MQKVLFLDVDGPLIPSTTFFVNPAASKHRHCSPYAIAIVNRLCRDANAKVVMNTYHNSDGLRLKDDLKVNGMDPSLFHPDWQTKYPHGLMCDEMATRLAAINEWQSRNGDVNWLCFDDSNFTSDSRLILVDFDAGITTKEYMKARKAWGLSGLMIF